MAQGIYDIENPIDKTGGGGAVQTPTPQASAAGQSAANTSAGIGAMGNAMGESKQTGWDAKLMNPYWMLKNTSVEGYLGEEGMDATVDKLTGGKIGSVNDLAASKKHGKYVDPLGMVM